MENVTRKNLSWTYGLLLGLVNILIAVVAYVTTENYMENNWMKSTLSFLIFAFFLVYPMTVLKKSQNGFLGFGDAIKLGMGISVISLIIGVAYLFIFAKFIEPGMYDMILRQSELDMEKQEMTAEQRQTALDFTERFMGLILYGSVVVVTLFLGLVISLIGGATLKRDAPVNYNN